MNEPDAGGHQFKKVVDRNSGVLRGAFDSDPKDEAQPASKPREDKEPVVRGEADVFSPPNCTESVVDRLGGCELEPWDHTSG